MMIMMMMMRMRLKAFCLTSNELLMILQLAHLERKLLMHSLVLYLQCTMIMKVNVMVMMVEDEE